MSRVRRAAVRSCMLGMTGSLLLAPVLAQEPATKATWHDDAMSRVEVLALLQSLNADLLSHASATLTLERWCDAHHLAPGSKIVAERVRGTDKPLPDDARSLLGIGPGEPVRYRHVRLACGSHVLSDADNWYVPSRLSDAMNHELDTTDTPFGKVVQPLHFRRQTLSAELLWSPLLQGWENGAPVPASRGEALDIPRYVLQHRAVLFGQDNRPLSLVVESYTAEVLAFPQPSIGGR